MMRNRVFALIIFFCLLMPVAVAAQDDVQEVAALLTVTHPGVEVRRVNTEAWIALSQGAVTIFGTGDSVRTDETGRALISTDENTLLILPTSEFALTTRYTDPETGAYFAGTVVRGQVIFDRNAADFEEYRASPGELAVVIFVKRDGENTRQTSLVSLIEENATVIPGGLEFAVPNAYIGFDPVYFNGEFHQLSADIRNPAMAEGVVEGCP
ncbi:MAG: hypothetical protein AAF787_13375, partial [Chloroflexota bacterium]